MADVQTIPGPAPHKLGTPPSGSSLAGPHGCGVSNLIRARLPLNTDVNQNGSFEFDRVIKTGVILKRTQRTKKWKTIYLVLRPNALYIYRNEKEDKLRHKLFLSDLTAVAFLKDPKQRRQNMFGLFSPSRNFHFQSLTPEDAQDWVDLIRRGTRIEEEEEEMFLTSPASRRQSSAGMGIVAPDGKEVPLPRTDGPERIQQQQQQQQPLSSSPEQLDQFLGRPSVHFAAAQPPESSGNDMTSHSDFSDTDTQLRKHGLSVDELGAHQLQSQLGESGGAEGGGGDQGSKSRRRLSLGMRSPGLLGGGTGIETDPDRVVWQGRLYYHRSKGGVRQWKKMWAVLRPRNLILYKDESEYLAQLVLPLSAIVSAVDIDPVSRTKAHCLQVITEEKSFRFCAPDEESLVQCLGAFKSLILKRRELDRLVVAG